MSEQIQVVVQLNKSKRVIRFEYQTGLPFFACLSKKLSMEGIPFSLCAGRGICGKCKIRFIKGIPLPCNAERGLLSAKELREGVRLACMAKPVRDCEIEILFEQDMTVVTEFNSGEGKKNSCINKTTEILMTADLGTTTIAMAALDMATGDVLQTYSCMNPQAVYGADVIARISAAKDLGADKLKNPVVDALIKGVRYLTDATLPKQFVYDKPVYVAANTTMSHFLAGSDGATLGEAPFRPEFLDSKTIEAEGCKFTLLPGVSAFVGGDIVAGMLSCNMISFEEKGGRLQLQNGIFLIDLGTNGEMALCNGKKIYCTSAAAGPAFEGKDILKHGSHNVNILAELLKTGQMDHTGFLHKYSDELSQQEIRDLQMAKAAVRTGIDVLLKMADMTADEVKKVCLAGGFGYYILVEAAVTIGLIPAEFKHITMSVGNASLGGAALYARIIRSGNTEKADRFIRENCIPVNLAKEDYFIDNYISNMNF